MNKLRALRIHFKLGPEEVIPNYVTKHVSLNPVYSEQDLTWAKFIAKGIR